MVVEEGRRVGEEGDGWILGGSGDIEGCGI